MEELEILYQRLKAPFRAAELEARPSTGVKNGRAKPAFFADPRAYQRRLDTLFGPLGWSVFTDEIHMVEDSKAEYTWNNDLRKREVTGSKSGLLVVSSVRLVVTFGGFKKEVTNIGEKGLDDESGNKATSSWAQAFKRACSLLGIGQYLYYLDLPPQPYNNGQFDLDKNVIDTTVQKALEEIGFKSVCEITGEVVPWNTAARSLHYCGRILCDVEAKRQLGKL